MKGKQGVFIIVFPYIYCYRTGEAGRIVAPEGGAGQILKIGELVGAVRKKVDRGFRRGQAVGADDVRGMDLVDIVRVVNGNLKMTRLVHHRQHGDVGVSEGYLEGWAQAIRDAHKRASEGIQKKEVGKFLR